MADLVHKLRDEECRREAQWTRSPMMSPPMKFTHGEPMRALLGQAATEIEALRKRCEAVEADAAMVESLRFAASRWKRESDYHASGIADDYGAGQRHAFLSCATEMLAIIDQAIAAAQEPSHG